MPPKPPEKHFALVWYILSFFFVVLALPLEFLGVDWWVSFERDLAIAAFAWFLSAEWAAGGVEDGYHGTYTSFIFWKIQSDDKGWWADTIRVLLGIVIASLVYWRFPHELYLNRIFGTFFLLWLPYHYSVYGIKGPVDKFFIWLGYRTGLAKLIIKIRG